VTNATTARAIKMLETMREMVTDNLCGAMGAERQIEKVRTQK
jgi:hypothetical protein